MHTSQVITAIGAIAAPAVTAGFLWYQIRRDRLSRAVDIVLQLDTKFNSDEWRERRSRAASEISAGKLDSEAENILDLLESIAFLTENRKVLDEEAVWHFFWYWMTSYYELMRNRIEERRRVDPTIWQDLVAFVSNLRNIEAKRRGIHDVAQVIPTPDELKKFLEEERTEGSCA